MNIEELSQQQREEELEKHCHRILSLLGENPEREGLLKTPSRVTKAMLKLTSGYDMDPSAILNSAKFKEDYSQIHGTSEPGTSPLSSTI